MMIFDLLKKIFDTKYTDKEIAPFKRVRDRSFESTADMAKRHAALLKKNGVTMQIYIASGGDHGHA